MIRRAVIVKPTDGIAPVIMATQTMARLTEEVTADTVAIEVVDRRG